MDVTLSWSINLDKNDEDLLRRREDITKATSVSIKHKGNDKEFWPVFDGSRIETLRVWADPNSKGVTINLTQTIDFSGQGPLVVFGDISSQRELICDSQGLTVMDPRGKFIYGKATKLGRGGQMPYEDEKLKLNISLKDCKYNEREKNAKCPLKVMV